MMLQRKPIDFDRVPMNFDWNAMASGMDTAIPQAMIKLVKNSPLFSFGLYRSICRYFEYDIMGNKKAIPVPPSITPVFYSIFNKPFSSQATALPEHYGSAS